jgi:hypothetical protein
MNSFNCAVTRSASSTMPRDFSRMAAGASSCLEIICARPRMMLSGFLVSCARPAAARFISRRWEFISLARSRRN